MKKTVPDQMRLVLHSCFQSNDVVKTFSKDDPISEITVPAMAEQLRPPHAASEGPKEATHDYTSAAQTTRRQLSQKAESGAAGGPTSCGRGRYPAALGPVINRATGPRRRARRRSRERRSRCALARRGTDRPPEDGKAGERHGLGAGSGVPVRSAQQASSSPWSAVDRAAG